MVKTHFGGWCSHQITSPCFFSVFLFDFETPCWVCLHCVLGWCSDWLCLGRCPSLSILPALILGFVCSIWAKFSNGDNYRGRPGERRRWVLPVYRVSCMLLQASQLHLPAFPLSAFIPVTVITGPVAFPFMMILPTQIASKSASTPEKRSLTQ